MAYNPFDDDAEVRRGRTLPYVQAGHWIILAPISAMALRLYLILLAHVFRDNPGREVRPTQDVLAVFLGLKKPEQVKRYADELKAFKAIDTDIVHFGQNNMKRKTIYTVHETPPEGFTGWESLGDYYKAQAEERKSAGHPIPPSKGGSTPPSEGGPVPPSEGGSIPPPMGDQLEVKNQLEEEVQTTMGEQAAPPPDPGPAATAEAPSPVDSLTAIDDEIVRMIRDSTTLDVGSDHAAVLRESLLARSPRSIGNPLMYVQVAVRRSLDAGRADELLPDELLSIYAERTGRPVRRPRPSEPSPQRPRAVPLPDDFAVSDAMRRWANGVFPGVNVDYETAQFVSNHRAQGGTRVSWPDEWQKWIRRSAQWDARRPAASAPRPNAAEQRQRDNAQVVPNMLRRKIAEAEAAGDAGTAADYRRQLARSLGEPEPSGHPDGHPEAGTPTGQVIPGHIVHD